MSLNDIIDFESIYLEKNYKLCRLKLHRINADNFSNALEKIISENFKLEDVRLTAMNFNMLSDVLFHTLSVDDLAIIDSINLPFESYEEEKQFELFNAYLKSLIFGSFIFTELVLSECLIDDSLSISFKLKAFNSYKRDFFDFRRKIKPKHVQYLSEELKMSLGRGGAQRDLFREKSEKLLAQSPVLSNKFNDCKFDLSSNRIVVVLEDWYFFTKSTVNKLILDWLYSLKKFYKQYTIEILVTRDFFGEGNVIPGQRFQEQVDLEQELLSLSLLDENSESITLEYCPRNVDFIEWLHEKLRAEPILSILTFPSPRWPLAPILKKYFPVVGVELANGVNLSSMAHVVLPNGVVTEQTERKYGEQLFVVEFPQIPFPTENHYLRHEFNISDNAFVIVSVGRQLVQRAKVDWANYQTEVMNILQINPDIVWVFIGEEVDAFNLENNLQIKDLVDSNRILIIPNEKDLMAFYELCDLFAMPPIGGGGRGIGLAASQQLPCITLTVSDGAKSMPEISKAHDINEYFKKIERCIKDRDFRQELIGLCSNVFGNDLLYKSASGLKEALEMANKRFTGGL